MSSFTPTPAYFSLLAGGLARAVELLVTFPTEFVKSTAQVGHTAAGPGAGTGPAALSAIVQETLEQCGIRGFDTGCAPFVAGNVLKAGVR